jgi:hypothetical protein
MALRIVAAEQDPDEARQEWLYSTNPGGTDIDLPARFRYRRTKPGYSPPAGVRVTRRECFSEVMRRRREDKGPAEAPPVKFRSG